MEENLFVEIKIYVRFATLDVKEDDYLNIFHQHLVF